MVQDAGPAISVADQCSASLLHGSATIVTAKGGLTRAAPDGRVVSEWPLVSRWTLEGFGSTPMTIEIGQVEEIFRFPVKSMAGEQVEVANMGWHGIEATGVLHSGACRSEAAFLG